MRVKTTLALYKFIFLWYNFIINKEIGGENMFDGDDFFDIIPDMDFDGDHDIVDFLILQPLLFHGDPPDSN
jgi:hypothetical protein